jgi:hypothetical protein
MIQKGAHPIQLDRICSANLSGLRRGKQHTAAGGHHFWRLWNEKAMIRAETALPAIEKQL